MTTFAKPLMSMMTALAVTLALFWLMNLIENIDKENEINLDLNQVENNN